MNDHPDLAYRVHCGATDELVEEVAREATAIVCALEHENEHRCGTWWERPFDHVSFYAPNVADPPRRQGALE